MPVKSIALHCRRCGADTPHVIVTPNHVLHGVLTLFTAGLWIFPWIFIAWSGDTKPVCSRCPRPKEKQLTAAERRANTIVIAIVMAVVIAGVVAALIFTS